jgi:16S rRNA (cytosine967-C5)-methyltransferase
MPKVNDARLSALNVLHKVIHQGESLSTAIPDNTSALSSQDKAFVQMLVYGVLRSYWRLQSMLKQLMKKPLKAKDNDVELVLLLALYQLMDTRVPDHASVNASVALVKKKKAWAAGLVNAVLRNFIRQQEALLQSTNQDEQAEYSHPQWIIDQLKQDWPEKWQAILQANNQQAPMVLRINQQAMSAEDYLKKLDVTAQQMDQGIVLEQPVDVTSLPGYDEGWFSVQDGGAQKAAPLLGLKAGLRVLDACAAPGGKTCHMLETEPAIHLVAMDVSDSRLMRVQENLERLNLSAELISGDAAQPDDWWDGQLFDRILLDVPCSASGVIRRHPDIKHLRRAEDIANLVQTQRDILTRLWPLLAEDGILLYATCSVFKQENEDQLAWFLQHTKHAQYLPIEVDWGEQRTYGRQIFPGQNDMDGFYYALLTKRTGINE